MRLYSEFHNHKYHRRYQSGNDHLAVCDETSLVKPDDYIVTDFFDKEYRFGNYDCDAKIDDYDP